MTSAAKQSCDEAGTCKVWVSLKHAEGVMERSIRDAGPGFKFEDTGRRSWGAGPATTLVRQLSGAFSAAAGRRAHVPCDFPIRTLIERDLIK